MSTFITSMEGYKVSLLAGCLCVLSACGGGNNSSNSNSDNSSDNISGNNDQRVEIPGDLSNECGYIYGSQLNNIFASENLKKRFHQNTGEYQWDMPHVGLTIDLFHFGSSITTSNHSFDDHPVDEALCNSLRDNLAGIPQTWEAEDTGFRRQGEKVHFTPVLDIELSESPFQTLADWQESGEPSSGPTHPLDDSKLTFQYFKFSDNSLNVRFYQLETDYFEETADIDLHCTNGFELNYHLNVYQDIPSSMDTEMCEFNNETGNYEFLAASVSTNFDQCEFITERVFLLDTFNQKTPVKLSGFISKHYDDDGLEEGYKINVEGIEFL